LFDPNAYTGQTGKITTSEHKNVTLLLKRKDTENYLPVAGKDGTIIVPVGDYELRVAVTVVTGENRSSWSVQYAPDKVFPVSVKADSTVKLDFGEPFTASAAVSVKQSGSKANVELVVTDRNGWKVGMRCNDQGATPPRFFAYNGSGNVVWYGAFKYG
jgi:WD40 repeat protein